MAVAVVFLFFIVAVGGTASAAMAQNMQTGSMPCFQDEKKIWINENHPFAAIKIGDVACYRPSDGELMTFGQNWIAPQYPLREPVFGVPHWFRLYFIFKSDPELQVCHRVLWRNETVLVLGPDSSRAVDPFSVGEYEYKGRVENVACMKHERH